MKKKAQSKYDNYQDPKVQSELKPWIKVALESSDALEKAIAEKKFSPEYTDKVLQAIYVIGWQELTQKLVDKEMQLDDWENATSLLTQSVKKLLPTVELPDDEASQHLQQESLKISVDQYIIQALAVRPINYDTFQNNMSQFYIRELSKVKPGLRKKVRQDIYTASWENITKRLVLKPQNITLDEWKKLDDLLVQQIKRVHETIQLDWTKIDQGVRRDYLAKIVEGYLDIWADKPRTEGSNKEFYDSMVALCKLTKSRIFLPPLSEYIFSRNMYTAGWKAINNRFTENKLTPPEQEKLEKLLIEAISKSFSDPSIQLDELDEDMRSVFQARVIKCYIEPAINSNATLEALVAAVTNACTQETAKFPSLKSDNLIEDISKACLEYIITHRIGKGMSFVQWQELQASIARDAGEKVVVKLVNKSLHNTALTKALEGYVKPVLSEYSNKKMQAAIVRFCEMELKEVSQYQLKWILQDIYVICLEFMIQDPKTRASLAKNPKLVKDLPKMIADMAPVSKIGFDQANKTLQPKLQAAFNKVIESFKLPDNSANVNHALTTHICRDDSEFIKQMHKLSREESFVLLVQSIECERSWLQKLFLSSPAGISLQNKHPNLSLNELFVSSKPSLYSTLSKIYNKQALVPKNQTSPEGSFSNLVETGFSQDSFEKFEAQYHENISKQLKDLYQSIPNNKTTTASLDKKIQGLVAGLLAVVGNILRWVKERFSKMLGIQNSTPPKVPSSTNIEPAPGATPKVTPQALSSNTPPHSDPL